MSYKPIHNYRRKDKLSPGDPDKIIYGSDLQDEFDAIAGNLDLLSQIDIDGDGNVNIPPELIDGLVDALGGKADQIDLEAEIAARIAGDKSLQDQINALDPDGDRTVDWNEIEGKPAEFPPAAHNHDGDYLKTETDPTVPDHVKAITTDDIDNWNAGGSGSGGASTWDELTGKPTEFPPEAHNQDWSTITNTPSEYPPEAHTHKQGDVDGLELRLEAIEDSITSGGGFVDAPNDGKLYGRQSEAWAEVVVPDAADPDWADIQNKPAEYPPESHDHDSVYSKLGHTHPTSDVIGLDAALGEITGDISDLEGAVGSLSGQLAFGGSYDASTGRVVKANLGGYEQGQALPDASTVLDTFVIVSIAGSNPEELNEGDWLVAGGSGWVPIKYGTAGTVDWSNIENAPDFDALYAEADHGHEEITKDAAYIKYVTDKWEASPAMSVTGDFAVGGETTLSGDLSVDGEIGATGNISIDGDLAVGGKVEGDLTVNGNIVIDGGGSISNPSGEEFITEAPEDGKQYARQDGAWAEVASDESAGAGGGENWEVIADISGGPAAFAEIDIPPGEYDAIRIKAWFCSNSNNNLYLTFIAAGNSSEVNDIYDVKYSNGSTSLDYKQESNRSSVWLSSASSVDAFTEIVIGLVGSHMNKTGSHLHYLARTVGFGASTSITQNMGGSRKASNLAQIRLKSQMGGMNFPRVFVEGLKKEGT